MIRGWFISTLSPRLEISWIVVPFCSKIVVTVVQPASVVAHVTSAASAMDLRVIIAGRLPHADSSRFASAHRARSSTE
jgi:hypothetical protein